MGSDIAAANISKGDLYYFEMNQKYFFLQVLDIIQKAAKTVYQEPTDIGYKYGFVVVVFDKCYKQVPSSVEELDLNNLYVFKHIWKKTTLYTILWGKEPHIKFNPDLYHYNYKDKYKLTFYGNHSVIAAFNPKIAFPLGDPSAQAYDSQGTGMAPHSGLFIQTMLWGLEQEEAKRLAKRKAIQPVYFREWLEYVEPVLISKVEKALLGFANGQVPTSPKKALTKCILTLNKLEDSHSFIYTIEAESLIEKLVALSQARGLTEKEAVDIIEAHRNW